MTIFGAQTNQLAMNLRDARRVMRLPTACVRALYSVFLASLVVLAPSSAAQLEPQDPSVVILFGDSITVGYNSETNFTERYGNGRTPAQLPASRPSVAMDRLLNQAQELRTSVIVNWGWGGTTSANGAGRIAPRLQTTQNQYTGRQYYVLIMYGTNDIAGGLSSSDTAFNTRQMINAVRARGQNFTPIVATLTPRDDRAVEPYNSAIVSETRRDRTQLVDVYGAFVNHPSGFRSLLGQDISVLTGRRVRLHPNVTGYDLIAQTWFEQALRGLIEPDPNPNPVLSGALLLLLGDE